MCAPSLAGAIREPTDLLKLSLIEGEQKRARWNAWFAVGGLSAPTPGGFRFYRSFMAIAAAVDGLGVTLESTRLAERELASGKLVAPLAGRASDLSYVGPYLVCPPQAGIGDPSEPSPNVSRKNWVWRTCSKAVMVRDYSFRARTIEVRPDISGPPHSCSATRAFRLAAAPNRYTQQNGHCATLCRASDLYRWCAKLTLSRQRPIRCSQCADAPSAPDRNISRSSATARERDAVAIIQNPTLLAAPNNQGIESRLSWSPLIKLHCFARAKTLSVAN